VPGPQWLDLHSCGPGGGEAPPPYDEVRPFFDFLRGRLHASRATWRTGLWCGEDPSASCEDLPTVRVAAIIRRADPVEIGMAPEDRPTFRYEPVEEFATALQQLAGLLGDLKPRVLVFSQASEDDEEFLKLRTIPGLDVHLLLGTADSGGATRLERDIQHITSANIVLGSASQWSRVLAALAAEGPAIFSRAAATGHIHGRDIRTEFDGVLIREELAGMTRSEIVDALALRRPLGAADTCLPPVWRKEL